MENITTMRRMTSCALLPSAAYRSRPTIAPMTAVQGTTLPASSGRSARLAADAVNVMDVIAVNDVAVVKGFGTPAGIRSWSPPV